MPASSAPPLRVVAEVGAKRVFVSALDWPGWSRSARDEPAAIAALLEYGGRYAAVARQAHVRFAQPSHATVVERLRGDATTDFGAPSQPAGAEAEPLGAAAAKRVVGLLEAAWAVLDRVAATSPAALRKGPRGGGRDRDAMLDHVLAAESAYARKIGVRTEEAHAGEAAAVAAQRESVLAALGAALRDPAGAGMTWLPRYAVRRIAWHALDHAWEMEDRSPA